MDDEIVASDSFNDIISQPDFKATSAMFFRSSLRGACDSPSLTLLHHPIISKV